MDLGVPDETRDEAEVQDAFGGSKAVDKDLQ